MSEKALFVPLSTGGAVKTKPSKYRAKKTVVDGVTFHSQKEARRYQELKLLEKAGFVSGLELQPEYALWTSAGKAHEQKPVGVYRADFRYVSHSVSGLTAQVVEDVKGFRTPLYRWKKKHVEAQYGITIREV